MAVKTIRNVNESTWLELKAIAARHDIPIFKLIETMVSEYSKHNENFWEHVLDGEKILSNDEAKDMKRTIVALRREHGFRA